MWQEQEGPAATDTMISELLTRFLQARVTQVEEGIAPDLGGEVVPHDPGSGPAVDARLAWDEALAAVTLGQPATLSKTLPGPCSAPDWRALTSAQEPALDLAFACGNFPQMVRNLGLLLQNAQNPSSPRGSFPNPMLIEWATKLARQPFPAPLLAVGLMRLSREFEQAVALLTSLTEVPAEWQAAWQNEKAAIEWHAGRREKAVALWQAGDPHHVPTLFNRGMAAFFLGKSNEARAPLTEAIHRIPEDNSWHHLARLYLTLAEMRG